MLDTANIVRALDECSVVEKRLDQNVTTATSVKGVALDMETFDGLL